MRVDHGMYSRPCILDSSSKKTYPSELTHANVHPLLEDILLYVISMSLKLFLLANDLIFCEYYQSQSTMSCGRPNNDNLIIMVQQSQASLPSDIKLWRTWTQKRWHGLWYLDHKWLSICSMDNTESPLEGTVMVYLQPFA